MTLFYINHLNFSRYEKRILKTCRGIVLEFKEITVSRPGVRLEGGFRVNRHFIIRGMGNRKERSLRENINKKYNIWNRRQAQFG